MSAEKMIEDLLQKVGDDYIAHCMEKYKTKLNKDMPYEMILLARSSFKDGFMSCLANANVVIVEKVPENKKPDEGLH